MPPTMASQMTATGAELNARPFTRPGEILEAAPGLIVTQHSGEGKANQYFLRGYNLDHGTDLAISVDDMPVNMRTHAHGQGYADLNWLMPETVNSLDIRKGPYFADEGDFASAGNLHINLIDRPEKNIAQTTLGSFGYQRYFGMGATKWGNGTLLAAGEVGAYNGPWVNPDDMRKLNGLLRYIRGDRDQRPVGDRHGLFQQMEFHRPGAAARDHARRHRSLRRRGCERRRQHQSLLAVGTDGRRPTRSARGRPTPTSIKSELDLYNNFTYFLANPVLGDQFHQHDDRLVIGGNASRTFNGTFGGLRNETTFGVQTRYDSISLGLTDTCSAPSCPMSAATRSAKAASASMRRTPMHWTDWFRTTVGWRGDFYRGDRQLDLRSEQFRQSSAAMAARNSPRCSDRSTRPSCSSARATACTATMRAAPPSPKPRWTASPIRSRHRPAAEFAPAGSHQGRRSRRPHQDRAGPRLAR